MSPAKTFLLHIQDKNVIKDFANQTQKCHQQKDYFGFVCVLMMKGNDWQAKSRVPMIFFAYEKFSELSEKTKLGELGESVPVKYFFKKYYLDYI